MEKKYYVLFFVFLCFCLTLLSDSILSEASTEKKTIDLIYDFDYYTAPLMYPVGSELFEEDMAFFSECELYAVCREEDESCCITMQFDTSDVRISEKGHYDLSLDLIYDKDSYILAECYQDHYTIPVCISNPDEFEVFLTYTSDYQTIFHYLYSFDDYRTISTLCYTSKDPLTLKELQEVTWIKSPSSNLINPTPDAIVVSSDYFSDDLYYYLKFENEGITSNLICAKKQDGLVICTPLEGDRDGGDFFTEEDENIRQVTETTDAPAATADATAVPSQSEGSPDTVIEEENRDTTSISGKRLRLMAESNPSYISFEHNDTILEIPTDYLLSLDPADDDVISVTLTSNKKKSPTVAVALSRKPLTSIPGSHLTQKKTNRTININQTGYYEFEQPGAAAPEKKNRITLIAAIFSGIILFSTGSFAFIKKKRSS